jgi:HEAT repeat protein
MPLIRKSSGGTGPSDSGGAAVDTLAALTRGSTQERWAAARAAAEGPGGAGALGRALSTGEDPRVREAIFTSLIRIRTAESVEAVLPHLRSDDAGLRTGALDALRAMPEVAAPYLTTLLQDADSDVRLLACDLARNLPSAQATRILCDLLEVETEGNVCAAAVDVLAENGGPEAMPVLARCSERFGGDPFLAFAIKVAADRIARQPADRRD